MAHVLTESEARCLGCGYLLRGLPEMRCPECGRTFDAADPMTMDCAERTRILRRRGAAQYWPIMAWLLTAVLGSGALCLLGPRDVGDEWVRLGLAVLAATLVRAAVRRRLGMKQDRSERIVNRALVVLSIAIMLRLGPVYYSCPHGELYGLGRFGLAHSTIGGPCRNHVNQKNVQIAREWYFWWVR